MQADDEQRFKFLQLYIIDIQDLFYIQANWRTLLSFVQDDIAQGGFLPGVIPRANFITGLILHIQHFVCMSSLHNFANAMHSFNGCM